MPGDKHKKFTSDKLVFRCILQNPSPALFETLGFGRFADWAKQGRFQFQPRQPRKVRDSVDYSSAVTTTSNLSPQEEVQMELFNDAIRQRHCIAIGGIGSQFEFCTFDYYLKQQRTIDMADVDEQSTAYSAISESDIDQQNTSECEQWRVTDSECEQWRVTDSECEQWRVTDSECERWRGTDNEIIQSDVIDESERSTKKRCSILHSDDSGYNNESDYELESVERTDARTIVDVQNWPARWDEEIRKEKPSIKHWDAYLEQQVKCDITRAVIRQDFHQGSLIDLAREFNTLITPEGGGWLVKGEIKYCDFTLKSDGGFTYTFNYYVSTFLDASNIKDPTQLDNTKKNFASFTVKLDAKLRQDQIWYRLESIDIQVFDPLILDKAEIITSEKKSYNKKNIKLCTIFNIELSYLTKPLSQKQLNDFDIFAQQKKHEISDSVKQYFILPAGTKQGEFTYTIYNNREQWTYAINQFKKDGKRYTADKNGHLLTLTNQGVLGLTPELVAYTNHNKILKLVPELFNIKLASLIIRRFSKLKNSRVISPELFEEMRKCLNSFSENHDQDLLYLFINFCIPWMLALTPRQQSHIRIIINELAQNFDEQWYLNLRIKNLCYDYDRSKIALLLDKYLAETQSPGLIEQFKEQMTNEKNYLAIIYYELIKQRILQRNQPAIVVIFDELIHALAQMIINNNLYHCNINQLNALENNVDPGMGGPYLVRRMDVTRLAEDILTLPEAIRNQLPPLLCEDEDNIPHTLEKKYNISISDSVIDDVQQTRIPTYNNSLSMMANQALLVFDKSCGSYIFCISYDVQSLVTDKSQYDFAVEDVQCHVVLEGTHKSTCELYSDFIIKEKYTNIFPESILIYEDIAALNCLIDRCGSTQLRSHLHPLLQRRQGDIAGFIEELKVILDSHVNKPLLLKQLLEFITDLKQYVESETGFITCKQWPDCFSAIEIQSADITPYIQIIKQRFKVDISDSIELTNEHVITKITTLDQHRFSLVSLQFNSVERTTSTSDEKPTVIHIVIAHDNKSDSVHAVKFENYSDEYEKLLALLCLDDFAILLNLCGQSNLPDKAKQGLSLFLTDSSLHIDAALQFFYQTFSHLLRKPGTDEYNHAQQLLANILTQDFSYLVLECHLKHIITALWNTGDIKLILNSYLAWQSELTIDDQNSSSETEFINNLLEQLNSNLINGVDLLERLKENIIDLKCSEHFRFIMIIMSEHIETQEKNMASQKKQLVTAKSTTTYAVLDAPLRQEETRSIASPSPTRATIPGQYAVSPKQRSSKPHSEESLFDSVLRVIKGDTSPREKNGSANGTRAEGIHEQEMHSISSKQG